MLEITVPDVELWDESKQEFLQLKGQSIRLEHSLVSLSKWESKWQKPFLTKQEKTKEELIDYIRCMTLTQNVDPNLYNYLPNKNVDEIIAYMKSSQTATMIREEKNSPSREQITSELIYYWMVAFNIPIECQKWYLNRLFTLIRICDIKNRPPKKYSKHELMSRNAALNAARRRQFNTNG